MTPPSSSAYTARRPMSSRFAISGTLIRAAAAKSAPSEFGLVWLLSILMWYDISCTLTSAF